MYKVKIADTETEAESAYELIYRSFGPTYYDCKEFFDSTRRHDPTLINKNLFIIKESVKERETIIAALCTVTRTLTIFDKKFDIGGLATTVVHPEYRGKGLFNVLTQFVLNEMASRNLSLCLVFARRAIDNIYVKHGFWGIPVERIFRILDPPDIADIAEVLSFRTAQIEDIPFLEKIYHQVYGHTPVFLDRPKPLWINKMKNPNFHKRFAAFICTQKGTDESIGDEPAGDEPTGYVISEHEKGIIDIGCSNGSPEIYKAILFSKDSPVRKAASMGISLSTAHPAIKTFRGYSYSIYTRHPHYGGHMLKILNPYDCESIIMKLVTSQLANRDSKISYNNAPLHVFSRVITAALFGYEVMETRYVLEISEESKWNILKPVDIIFSAMDEF